jgi:membrane protease YdiL (CAAX protease family)
MAEWRGAVFLLLGMAAWIAAGFAGAALATAILAAASLTLRTGMGLTVVPLPDQLVYVLIAACGFQATLLVGALWQGRRVGLGVRRIRRVNVVALLCVATIVWLLGFFGLVEAFPALRDFVKSVTPELLSGLDNGGPAVTFLKVTLIAILAPVSEELFFRGWLWEGLRQRGYAITMTSGLTAIPWLMLHGIDSPGRVLFLIPAAAIFSIARQMSGSVIGSLAVHMTNNTTAILMQVIAQL